MKRLSNAFLFAWNGITACFVSEANFRIHTVFSIVAVILAFALHISAFEWIAISFCIAFVIAMEMLNTAMEKLCNVVQQQFHPGIKTVKDMAAGAVLVAAACSLITGLIIFLPKIISCFKTN